MIKNKKQDYEHFKKYFDTYFEKANRDNDPISQYAIGIYYYDGLGVEVDYKEAVKWFSKAAEQGLQDAQRTLGRCYEDGKGVEQSYKKAEEWYNKAYDNSEEARLRHEICLIKSEINNDR